MNMFKKLMSYTKDDLLFILWEAQFELEMKISKNRNRATKKATKVVAEFEGYTKAQLTKEVILSL